MTTPNPWERLREAVNRFGDFADHKRNCKVARYRLAGVVGQQIPDCSCGFGVASLELREALAALPATPPQQPVPDAERERAIEEWDKMLLDANNKGKPGIIDYCRRKGVALMRSAPATCQPDAERERAIEEWRKSATDTKAQVIGAGGSVEYLDDVFELHTDTINEGIALMRSAPAPQPEVVEMHSCEIPHLILTPGVTYRFTPAEACQACADYLNPPRKPAFDNESKHMAAEAAFNEVPAPPASDWRERFDQLRRCLMLDPGCRVDGDSMNMFNTLRDGLAALEAEVARLRSKKP